MKLKLACADFTFPLLAHDDALRLIAAMGFEGADIGLFERRSHLWPSIEFKNAETSGRELRRKLDELKLQCADVFLQMDPDFVPLAINHPDAAARKKARDWFACTLDYAQAAGCKHVTTLPGVEHAGQPPEQSWKCAVDELSWRVEQSRSRGITFGVEAHVGSLAPDPKSAQRLVRDTPGLTLTLDYTHFTRAGLSDDAIEPLIPLASHFHARGARLGRLQCSVKDNVINYQRVLRKLADANYTGWVGVEYVWVDWEHCNECDNVSETILLRDCLRNSGSTT